MSEDPMRDLPMTSSDIDRDAASRTDPHLLERLLADPRTQVLELRGGRAPLRPEGTLARRSPRPEDADTVLVYLGRDQGLAQVAACDLSEEPARGGEREAALDAVPFAGLREVAVSLPASEASLFAMALGLANWHARHGYCPRCGSETQIIQAGWVRRCPQDGSEHYPRTDGAMIVAVTDAQDRLLLARSVGWPEGRFSVLAGFIEPGERIAAAVAREVFEETGVRVTDVRYVADQPWPFPASLMIGCTARAVTTDLICQPDEIAEARWFSREDFVGDVREGYLRAAGRLSISSRLIEGWLGRRLDDLGEDSVGHR